MVEYKQSNPEDEFFAKENAEKMRRLRMKLDAERKAIEAKQLKEMHWMRCPKCGEQLQELPFKTIMIDKCTGCGDCTTACPEGALRTSNRRSR